VVYGVSIESLAQRQLVIINIGSSTSYGVPGPIFNNGHFVFVPIPEGWPGKETPTYEELGLSEWVSHPKEYAHYDPEFETMTYGDREHKTRVANARKLKQEDFLFFFASLSNEFDRKKRRPTGFFFIGFFEIERIISPQEAKRSPLARKNAHVRRRGDSGFSVWKGSRRSGLLVIAVPLDKKSSNMFLRTGDGKLLPWGSKNKNGRIRTDLEVINSATRASRMILPKYRKAFWELIKQSNPDLSVFER
jgi:hypothetical protein